MSLLTSSSTSPNANKDNNQRKKPFLCVPAFVYDEGGRLDTKLIPPDGERCLKCGSFPEVPCTFGGGPDIFCLECLLRAHDALSGIVSDAELGAFADRVAFDMERWQLYLHRGYLVANGKKRSWVFGESQNGDIGARSNPLGVETHSTAFNDPRLQRSIASCFSDNASYVAFVKFVADHNLPLSLFGPPCPSLRFAALYFASDTEKANPEELARALAVLQGAQHGVRNAELWLRLENVLGRETFARIFETIA